MKYLPIKQSVINTHDNYHFTDVNYHFTDVKWRNRKFKFSKFRFTFSNILHDDMLRNFTNVFKKYLNNDIEINWEK
jgi:hypothetical protein